MGCGTVVVLGVGVAAAGAGQAVKFLNDSVQGELKSRAGKAVVDSVLPKKEKTKGNSQED